MSEIPFLLKIVRKLKTRVALDVDDCDAIMALPCSVRTHEPPNYILREGEPPNRYCSFVLAGLAFRQKLTATGARQIVSIHMPGDFLDLQNLFFSRADHSLQVLTPLTTAEIDRDALRTLTLERPNVARAMWIDTLIQASILHEWIVNVGRRDARTRVAHLLCEFSLRMQHAGLSKDDSYDFPLTQEQLGDAVGLTSVHINRTLKALADEGLIERGKRNIRFHDWQAISAVGDFNARYLHLDQDELLGH